jgi:hypothetical protein
MFYGIWLVVLGALAIPSLILSKKPELKPTLDKLTPYQGWLGAISAIWGAFGIVQAILNLGWLSKWPIWWVTFAGTNAVTFGLGILLGIGTLKTFIKNAAAQAKLDQTFAKIAPLQGKLGIAAIALGAWCVVGSLILMS